MMRHKAIPVFCAALILTMSACSRQPPAAPTLSVEQAAATLVAMTFQAATQSASQHLIANTPTALPSPVTVTPTLYISNNVNCRTGTGPNFKVVAAFAAGTTVEMVGRDASASYWLVKVPNTSETCWLQTIDGTPGGSYESLPVVTPQPSTQSVPILGGLVYNFFCSYNTNLNVSVTTYLSWTDASKNANGFRIYRSNVQVVDLPADTTTYTDTTNVDVGAPLTYGLEAYNDGGVSPRKTITINTSCK